MNKKAIVEVQGVDRSLESVHALKNIGFTFTENRGADVVFEVSGSVSGLTMMTTLAGIRGKIIMVAIYAKLQEVSLFQFFWKELEMFGARVYEPKDYEQVIEIVASEKLPLKKGNVMMRYM